MKNKLKAWVRQNPFTANPNDGIAVVSSAGSINRSGLIDALIAEGIELKRETVEDVINRFIRISASYAAMGWNVDAGLVYMHPVITGSITGKRFDPERNKVYVATTQGMDIRKELSQTEVEILGDMPDVMYIQQVVNLKSNLSDGILNKGRNIQVDGACLKVVGNDPHTGVYLTSTTTGNEWKLDAEYIITNRPSKLILLLPADMPSDVYRLKIVTQYSAGSKHLKAPRETVFTQELTII